MVRVNLVDPLFLADQHLVAEYNEILMLLGYVRKHPDVKDIPSEYCLGKGHIKFFKNKLAFLQERHEEVSLEMRTRGFQTNKKIDIGEFSDVLIHDWTPSMEDVKISVERMQEKLRKKPSWYRWYGKSVQVESLIESMRKEIESEN